MKCTDCKYCIKIDTGYSNYTAMGTDADCLLRLNPDFPEDEFYGKETSLFYAQGCDNFIEGECVNVDVDMEYGELENYSDDVEVKELLKKYAAKQ